MATAALGTQLKTRWLISRRQDLGWVIGSSLAGYIYLALFAVFHAPFSWLWWFWSVGLDGTHIFATVSRTWLDPAMRAREKPLLFGSLAFFLLGPVLILAGAKLVLALLVGVWAYYHVLQQHYGFLMLYKVKQGDLRAADNRLDRTFLTVMLAAPPFHRFFVHHPEELGIPARFALARLEPLFWVLVGLTAFMFLHRQWERRRLGIPVNVPKLLLLAAVVPLHWLTFAWLSWRAAIPTVTIVHNLQYHALVWFHNRNRYESPPRRITSSIAWYIGAALLFSLAYRVPGFQLTRISDLAFGFFCGFGLTHYYLDSRIWRVRRDPALRQALRLAA